MAQDFAGVDFSQYHNWRPIRTATGGVYYAVPNTSFVYDPFLSSTRGRPVLWTNPEPTIKEKQDAEKAQKEARSPLNTFVSPVAAATIGAVAGPGMIDYLNIGQSPAEIAAENAASKLTANSVGVSPTGGAMGGGAVSTPPGTTGDAFSQGLASGAGQYTPAANPDLMSGLNQPANAGFQTPVSPTGVEGAMPNQSMVSGNTGYNNGMSVNQDGSVSPGSESGDSSAFGAYAQGAAGALQGYQGIQQLRDGDYVGGGVNVGSGLSNLAAATKYKGFGSETLGRAAPWLGGAAGVLGAIETADITGGMAAGSKRNSSAALSGAAAGAGFGTMLGGPLLGTAIGAAIGYLGSAAFGSGKSKQQFIRDDARKYLKETGIIDENYLGTLADGTKFDFGKDGKGLGKLKYDDPTTGKVIALSNVLSSGEGMSGKSREAMAELYANAALSNSGGDLNKAKQNVLHMATQRGFNLDNVQKQLDQMLADKKLKQEEYNVFSADAKELFGATPALPPGARRNWQPGDPVSKQTQNKIAKQLAARMNARDKRK